MGSRPQTEADFVDGVRILVLVQQMTIQFDGHLRDVDLTSNVDVLALIRLRTSGACRPRDLQVATGLTSGGVTKLLDRLERLGVAQRGPGIGDLRSVRVALTPPGKRRADLVLSGLRDALEDIRPQAKEILEILDARGPTNPAAGWDELRGAKGSLIVLRAAGHLGERIHEVTAAAVLEVASDASPLPQRMVCLVGEKGGIRPTELAQGLGLSSGGLSKLLDRMEAAGFVAREYGTVPGDRRASVVTLTAKGRRAVVKIGQAVLELEPELRAVMRQVLDYRSV